VAEILGGEIELLGATAIVFRVSVVN